jgi:hypothetical protein
MSTEQLEIDHVVIGVADLEVAAARLLEEHGLVALPGGHHPAWGTANRIVPLGPTYLELVAVVDPVVAAQNAFGTWVTDMARGSAGGGWAVRTHDMAATATRLGLDVVPGSRLTSDGVELRWQLAGLPSTDAPDRTLPFFIAWADGTPLPGTAPAAHRGGSTRLERITVESDPPRLDRWVAGHELGVDVARGAHGVTAVRCSSTKGVVHLELPL